MRHFEVEVREDGWTSVVASPPDPATRQRVRDTPEDAPWSPLPAGRWASRAEMDLLLGVVRPPTAGPRGGLAKVAGARKVCSRRRKLR